MNSNTILGYINGTKRGQIPAFTLTSVTETLLPAATDTGTAPAFIAVPQQNAILGATNGLGPNGNAAILVQPFGVVNNTPDGNNAPYYNSGSFDLGRPFVLKLIGTAVSVAGASNALTVKIYNGTSATLGSNTIFTTPITALAAVTAVNLRFYVSVTCFWDSVSQTLTGNISGQTVDAGTSALIAAATTSTITGLTSPAALSFVPSITWGAANGGTVNISEWSLEQI